MDNTKIQVAIDKCNWDLYNSNYNEKMITTKEDFIKYYQNFIDEEKKINGRCSLESHLLTFMNKAKESNHIYVIDSIMNDEQIDLFSTIEELEELMKEFDIE